MINYKNIEFLYLILKTGLECVSNYLELLIRNKKLNDTNTKLKLVYVNKDYLTKR